MTDNTMVIFETRERKSKSTKTSFVVVNVSSHFVLLAIYNVQRWATRWALGCVNPAFWPQGASSRNLGPTL